jgi:hypothetical protein
VPKRRVSRGFGKELPAKNESFPQELPVLYLIAMGNSQRLPHTLFVTPVCADLLLRLSLFFFVKNFTNCPLTFKTLV